MAGEQVVPAQEQEKNEESRARLFPTSGGILRTMDWEEDSGYSRLTIDGTENCIHALKEIMDGTLSNCFIEMSACTGSCVGGPVMEKGSPLPRQRLSGSGPVCGKRRFCGRTPADSLKKDIPYLGLNRQMPAAGPLRRSCAGWGRPPRQMNSTAAAADMIPVVKKRWRSTGARRI